MSYTQHRATHVDPILETAKIAQALRGEPFEKITWHDFTYDEIEISETPRTWRLKSTVGTWDVPFWTIGLLVEIDRTEIRKPTIIGFVKSITDHLIVLDKVWRIKMNNDKLWRYGSLDRLLRFYHPERLIGKEIGVYTKRDGSNIARWFEDSTHYISTRKAAMGANDLVACMKRTDEYQKTKQWLEHVGPQGLIIFGELVKAGRSPAQFEVNDKEEYIVFEMAHSDNVTEENPHGFFPLHYTYTAAKKFGIPTCPLVETFIPTDLDDLFSHNDRLVAQSQELKLEGYVCKTLDGLYRWKVKSDIKGTKADDKKDKPVDPRPHLPDSEAFGAVEKARDEIGDAAFVDVKLAMPLIAKYIMAEELKHGCQKPRANYFYYYQTRLSQI